MKQITAEDVHLLQKETGEGMMACKKILVERYKADEKKEAIQILDDLSYNLNSRHSDVEDALNDIWKILDYLVRRS